MSFELSQHRNPGYQRGLLSRLARFATSFPGTVAGTYIWFKQAASAWPVVEVKQQDLNKASTSYVERQNLSMRMGMRRFTRLTNGFSKKVENLACAVSLHYMYYNFARPKNDARDGCRGRQPRVDAPRHHSATRLASLATTVHRHK